MDGQQNDTPHKGMEIRSNSVILKNTPACIELGIDKEKQFWKP